MAEIIGFAASITALVTVTVQVGSHLSSFIGSVKDASENLTNLLSEISSLISVLMNLKQTIESPNFKDCVEPALFTGHKGNHWRFVKETVEDCLKTLNSLEAEFERHGEPQPKRQRVIGKLKTHFRLANEESRIKSYRTRINAAKDAINISLAMLTLLSQYEIDDSVNNLLPRLDQTSAKIDEVLSVLNQQLKETNLGDNDKESIHIAQRVAQTASDIVSMATTSVASVSDKTETQSVVHIDPNKQNSVLQWVQVEHESQITDPITIRSRAFLESGRTALAKKDYHAAEELFDSYLALVECSHVQQNPDELLEIRLDLCQTCLELGKVEKAHRVVNSASQVMGDLLNHLQRAKLQLAYVDVSTHESHRDASAAELSWRNAILSLEAHHGPRYEANMEMFERLKAAKLKILECRNEVVDQNFWAKVCTVNSSGPVITGASGPSMRKPTASECESIEGAISSGDIEAVQEWMLRGIDVLLYESRSRRDTLSQHYLNIAIMSGKRHMVYYLLKIGADPNLPGGLTLAQPLHIVASSIESEETACVISRILINHGAKFSTKDAFGDLPIHVATKSKKWKLVRLFIQEDSQVKRTINQYNDAGFTPLSLVDYFDADNSIELEIVQLMVESGADMNAEVEGSPCWWKFEASPSTKLFQYLVLKGADMKHVDKVGDTILHQPTFQFDSATDWESCKAFVLENDLDINAVGGGGNTPLICAIVNNNFASAIKMIEIGCDVEVKNNRLESALYHTLMAQERSNTSESKITIITQLESLLIQKGADPSDPKIPHLSILRKTHSRLEMLRADRNIRDACVISFINNLLYDCPKLSDFETTDADSYKFLEISDDEISDDGAMEWIPFHWQAEDHEYEPDLVDIGWPRMTI